MNQWIGIVECRSIARIRVQLGDPSQDVYDYQIYSCLNHKDFDLQAYNDDFDTARVIAKKDRLLELGGQYAVVLTQQGEEKRPRLCCIRVFWNCVAGRFEAVFRAEQHDRDAEWWPSTKWVVWAKSRLPWKVGDIFSVVMSPLRG